MARVVEKLTAIQVRTAKPGRYGDGGGLFLLVRPTARYWLFRYKTRDGRMREMGLGPAGEGKGLVSLAAARKAASPLWRGVKDGADPLADREAKAMAARAEVQKAKIADITFRDAAEAYMRAHAAGWRNPKHRGQWRATLGTYAYPHLGDLPIADVGTAYVLAALEPIWRVKPETASRLRGRIEATMDYAKVREWRTGENPARWRGHLDHLLPARAKMRQVRHHAALPWPQIGAFMAALREQAGIGARALELAILAACRTGEVIGATWGEIDMAGATWTVPPVRMKAGKEHRVSLSGAALALLGDMAAMRLSSDPAAFVFPGAELGRPLSNMAMAMVLRRMGHGDMTVHGFRSSFRDWARETTGYPPEVAEAAWAHVVGDKTVAAHARGDLFEKRRRLMDDWGAYCAQPAPVAGDTVVPLRRPA